MAVASSFFSSSIDTGIGIDFDFNSVEFDAIFARAAAPTVAVAAVLLATAAAAVVVVVASLTLQ